MSMFVRSLSVLAIAAAAIAQAQAQLVCQPAPDPIIIQGSLNVGDVQQAGRITRDGSPATCRSGGGAVLENNTALRRDTHNFVNPLNENVCVKVEVDFTGCAGNQTQSAAYSSFNPAQPAQNVIGDMGYSTINTGSYLFPVGPNANFTIGVNEVDQNSGCPLYKLKITYLRNCRQPGFDRTNDGKADIAVYRVSSNSQWWVLDSSNGQAVGRNFGTVGDLVTGGGDYTGDGRTDLSVYRTSTSTWYYGLDQDNPSQNFAATQWGTSGDRPVPGDYDGDGKNDVAIWRPSNGTFYVLRSSDGTALVQQWGVSTDRNVVGDFDGDTRSDFAIVRPTIGGLIWYILKSNYNYGFNQAVQWGLATDDIIPADFDGDAITDIAIWRDSTGVFYVRRSSDLALQSFQWGTSNDLPQPVDFDGDYKADYAVYRASQGMWYIRNSSTATFRYEAFGLSTDVPVSAPYRVQ